MLNKIINLSLIKILENIYYFYNRTFRSTKKISQNLKSNYSWSSINYNRIAVLNLIISNIKNTNLKYLEIGCDENKLFDSIPIKYKVGVDPNRGGNIKKTSDVFFAENNELFDIIFIDGLHTYQQVRRDAINALNSLEMNGWVVFHDMIPLSWEEQHVPRINSDWTGDCWKLIIELLNSKSLDFKIVTVDFGVLILRKTSKDYYIPDMQKTLDFANYDLFLENLKKMPLIKYEELEQYIQSAISSQS